MIIYDKEEIVEWLTEISLRPCDFSRPEDYDENMTEDLADGALALLKEQNAEIWQLRLALKIASGKGFHYTVSSANVGDVIIETKAEKPEEGR